MDEFRQKKDSLDRECRLLCNAVLQKKNLTIIPNHLRSKITYQGGIGTHFEQDFLMNEYHLDGTGWATPFLLVPEVTTLDTKTRNLLKNAVQNDCYLSGISPLGVPFNTVRGTDSEEQKNNRIQDGKPGSPCPKGYLISNTEFSKQPVCKASVFYQKRKIEQLKLLNLLSDDYNDKFLQVVEKACLCEDLAAPALIEYKISNNRPLKPTVCAGPNIAYFNKVSTLKEMIDHIYGRANLINDHKRPPFFMAELRMYIDYFRKELKTASEKISKIELKRWNTFAKNLQEGIQYYMSIVVDKYPVNNDVRRLIIDDILDIKSVIDDLVQNHLNILCPSSSC